MKNIYCIGSYTDIQGHAPHACGKGIYVLSQDGATGELSLESTFPDINNPSWLHWDRERKKLYGVTENPGDSAEIVSLELDDTLSLTAVKRRQGPGNAVCHLLSLSKRDLLCTVSYISGTMEVFSLEKGLPDRRMFSFQYRGSGPNAERQEGPHAHQLCSDINEDFLYVCDLGSDRIWMHDLKSSGLKQSVALKVPGGYGPRHMVMDKRSSMAYILCELQPRLLVVRVSCKENDKGRMEFLEEHDTAAPEDFKKAAPAAVKIHPSGNTVYVSNRFTDSISVFIINRNADGRVLNKVDEFGTRGKTPRDLSFSPDGRWLLIANQDSSDIQCRHIDSESGRPLEKWSSTLNIDTPVCITPII